jgi:hypothetical protein
MTLKKLNTFGPLFLLFLSFIGSTLCNTWLWTERDRLMTLERTRGEEVQQAFFRGVRVGSYAMAEARLAHDEDRLTWLQFEAQMLSLFHAPEVHTTKPRFIIHRAAAPGLPAHR